MANKANKKGKHGLEIFLGILIVGVVVVAASYSGSDEDLEGKFRSKSRVSNVTPVATQIQPSSTATANVGDGRWAWEVDSSYRDRYVMKVGDNPQGQSGVSRFCSGDQVVHDINTKMETGTDGKKHIIGLSYSCKALFGSNASSTGSWGSVPSGGLNAAGFVLGYKGFYNTAGSKSFIKKLDYKRMNLNNDMYQSTVSNTKSWLGTNSTNITTSANNQGFCTGTSEANNAEISTLSLISGMKIYSETHAGKNVLSGIDVYCTRFNWVE
jgi:hypothetical protein